jgi:hypothetical protein
MRWSEAAWIVAVLTLWNGGRFQVERAAQLAVLGVLLDVTARCWLGPIVKAPLVWFVGAGMVFEILHLLHNRRTKTMRHTWIQLERLRGQKDLSTLIALMMESPSQVGGSQLEKVAFEHES